MAVVVKPPVPRPANPGSATTVFLAGSIDQGSAVDWQRAVEDRFADLDVVILNPRRDDWDPTWDQSPDDPEFRRQVEWELDGLVSADLVLLHLAPGTQAPISLLELGLHIGHAGLRVCCPPDYWRRGNVAIVCERHAVALWDDFDHFVDDIARELTAQPTTRMNCKSETRER